MNSIINEIKQIKHTPNLHFDSSNKNKYCIITKDDSIRKTAYCFGVPIYNTASRRLIDLTFRRRNGLWRYEGSNSSITIDNDIDLKTQNDVFKIKLSDSIINGTDKIIYRDHSELYPTLNGLAVKMHVDSYRKSQIRLVLKTSFFKTWVNDRCFALMKTEYEPIITISCIGALSANGMKINPCKLSYKKINSNEVLLEFIVENHTTRSILFEINSYEKKLFQDTTVETKNPNMNNAFGGTAYIGTTDAFGEQWLYTRIDYSLIPELLNCMINRVVWHLPKISANKTVLNAHTISGRFCSFGSTWDNKIPMKNFVSGFFQTEKYQSINITNNIVDPKTKKLTITNGLIVNAEKNNNSFSVISTGDSFYAPQILEISYQ